MVPPGFLSPANCSAYESAVLSLSNARWYDGGRAVTPGMLGLTAVHRPSVHRPSYTGRKWRAGTAKDRVASSVPRRTRHSGRERSAGDAMMRTNTVTKLMSTMRQGRNHAPKLPSALLGAPTATIVPRPLGEEKSINTLGEEKSFNTPSSQGNHTTSPTPANVLVASG